MTSKQRRQIDIPSGTSVLDELYTGTPTPPPPAADPEPPRVDPVSNTPGTPDARPAARKPTNRTPAGKTRHTLYLSADTAAELDAAAERLRAELRGLVPKHVILSALITAGVRQSATVLAELRAGLLSDLGA